jgi:hypothetical protein
MAEWSPFHPGKQGHRDVVIPWPGGGQAEHVNQTKAQELTSSSG